MTITIVTTAGDSTANSYVTLAEASAYFEAKPSFSTLWLAMTSAVQNAWLVESCRCMDRLPFSGVQAYPLDQALQFPRTVLEPGTPYVTTEIPAVVKSAQCETIIALYGLGKTTGGESDRGIASVNVGAISVTFDPKPAEASSDLLMSGTFAAVRALLRDWLSSDNSFRFLK